LRSVLIIALLLLPAPAPAWPQELVPVQVQVPLREGYLDAALFSERRARRATELIRDSICATQQQMMNLSVTDTALWQPATLWERAMPAISNR